MGSVLPGTELPRNTLGIFGRRMPREMETVPEQHECDWILSITNHWGQTSAELSEREFHNKTKQEVDLDSNELEIQELDSRGARRQWRNNINRRINDRHFLKSMRALPIRENESFYLLEFYLPPPTIVPDYTRHPSSILVGISVRRHLAIGVLQPAI